MVNDRVIIKIPLEKLAIYCQLVDPSVSLNTRNMSATANWVKNKQESAMIFFM